MPTKIRDIAVKTGTYQDSYGNTKGVWQNVGAMMKGDDGGEFIILKRWFNPAGVTNPDNRDSVMMSCFPLRDQQGNQQAGQQGQQSSGGQQSQQSDDFDDGDVPF